MKNQEEKEQVPGGNTPAEQEEQLKEMNYPASEDALAHRQEKKIPTEQEFEQEQEGSPNLLDHSNKKP